MTLQEVQKQVDALDAKGSPCDREMISDGFHTFKELYDHRIALFVALCKLLNSWHIDNGSKQFVWRSKLHADGSSYDGSHYFWLEQGVVRGKQGKK